MTEEDYQREIAALRAKLAAAEREIAMLRAVAGPVELEDAAVEAMFAKRNTATL